MKLSEAEKAFFDTQVEELLLSEKVKEMDKYVQHGNTSCLQHCFAVAYYSYLLSRQLPIACDGKSLIRGAMLHDFFLYDWHVHGKSGESHRLHGFTHPKTALKNARKYMALTDKESNIIRRHMWPLTVTPPGCREAWIICIVDKACSLYETVGPYCGRDSYGITRSCEIGKPRQAKSGQNKI